MALQSPDYRLLLYGGNTQPKPETLQQVKLFSLLITVPIETQKVKALRANQKNAKPKIQKLLLEATLRFVAGRFSGEPGDTVS